MGQHDEPPFEATATEQAESEQGRSSCTGKDTLPVLATEAPENAAACEPPQGNWEGYRPEILSVWFDP